MHTKARTAWPYGLAVLALVSLVCVEGQPLPVYGRGENVRDWLFVEDHARALILIAEKGRVGESYNVGGNNDLVIRGTCADCNRSRVTKRRLDLI